MKKWFCIFGLYVRLLASGLAWGQEARITDVIVTNTRDDLILYFKVEGCFTEDLQQAVLSGVPTTFTCWRAFSRYSLRRAFTRYGNALRGVVVGGS